MDRRSFLCARSSVTVAAQSLYLQLLQREATPKETAVAARILTAGTSTTQPAVQSAQKRDVVLMRLS